MPLIQTPNGIPIKGLGFAGTPNAEVVTVQGIVGGVGFSNNSYMLNPVTGVWLPLQGNANSGLDATPPPYDSEQYSEPAAATLATITFNATPGKRWKLHYLVGCAVSPTGAVAISVVLRVTDGATRIFAHRMASGAGSNISSNIAISGLGLIGTANTNLVVAFNAAGGAGTFESISAGAYLID
jgi:hypothetical protein